MAGCRAGSEGVTAGGRPSSGTRFSSRAGERACLLTRAEPEAPVPTAINLCVCVLPYALRAGHSCEGGVYVLSFGRGGTRALGHTREKRRGQHLPPWLVCRASRK